MTCWWVVMNRFIMILLLTPAMLTGKANAEALIGSSSANIEQAISIVENNAMDFATILPDMAGDVVELREFSVTSQSGNSVKTGSAWLGIFEITGVPYSVVEVEVTDTAIDLTGPGQTMVVNNFIRQKGSGTTLALDGTGSDLVYFGADLIINANQLPGQYSGTYNISVNYQ